MQFGALAGAYTGASKSRRSFRDWVTGGGSADADTLWDLPTLRERSRDLVRNSAIASGAINTDVTSVIGPGLKLRAEVDHNALGITKEQAKEFETKAEQLWALWAESLECDAARSQNFAGLEDLVYRSSKVSGDVFVALPMFSRIGSPFGLKVQVIEADRISNPDGEQDTKNLAGGINMDNRGAPTHVNIQRGHPGDTRTQVREWDKIRMFGATTGRQNILHIGHKDRPGQTRYVPFLAPVIESLKQITKYTDTELMAAVVSGMFTVAITTETGDSGLAPFTSDGQQPVESPPDYKMGNGAIIELAKGDGIETMNPGRPNSEFDPFVQAILVQVGMSLEIPYEVLIKHFSSSFSAAQASMLEAWRAFISRRSRQSAQFNQPIYDSFIGEQVASGRLAAPGFFADPLIRKAYTSAKWVGRPKGHIREDIAVKASVMKIDNKLATRSQETAEISGGNWEKDEAQRQHEETVMSTIVAPAVPQGGSTNEAT